MPRAFSPSRSSVPPHNARARGFPLWGWLGIAVLVLIAIAAGGSYWYLRASRPQLTGTLKLAALHAPVTVVRDTRGIPHITARNLHDLYVAQGFVMAQDRLWQMDLMRRMGEGRLAEIFGPRALPFDKEARELGLGRMARREAAQLEPNERQLLDDFAAGVNANIARRRDRLPLAFWLLGYRPAPWRPRDTLALASDMYRVLASDFQSKLMREAFAAKLGPELAQDLFPDHSPWDVIPGGPLPPPLSRPSRPGPFTSASSAATDWPRVPVFAASLHPPAHLRGGSNEWVLSGGRSFTGKPILANDPHLTFQVPGLWWAVQLTAPGLNAAGVAIAGVPGVIIGHNGHIAWGVTNSEADVQDLYRARLDGHGDVLTPGGWKPLQYWHETIAVKGQKPVKMTIPVTPHGPIVAHDAGGPLALDWTMFAPGALQSVHVFLALDEARNWSQFRAALAQFPGPTLNFVYADQDGNIGYQCAGWVPVRSKGDGALPVPGNDPAYDWQGWIPFDRLPSVYDPKNGVLATANGRITPDGYPYTISTDWDAPNRTRRIYQLLDQLPHWNPSAMGHIQTDVTSEQDADFARAVVAAAHAEEQKGITLGAPVRTALRHLRFFDGAMGHESVAPTLAVMTRREFLRRVLAAKTGDAMAAHYRWDEAPVFEQWLLARRPKAWLPPRYAKNGGWDALLVDSLARVVQRYTLDPAQLHWGIFETLEVDHPVYSHVPFLRHRADLGPVEINGSRLTIKQARNVALGAASDLGPSMRFVADPADWDRSTLTLVAGESGRVFSPHYRDEFRDYLEGKALPLWFTPAAVAAHRGPTLTLTP